MIEKIHALANEFVRVRDNRNPENDKEGFYVFYDEPHPDLEYLRHGVIYVHAHRLESDDRNFYPPCFAFYGPAVDKETARTAEYGGQEHRITEIVRRAIQGDTTGIDRIEILKRWPRYEHQVYLYGPYIGDYDGSFKPGRIVPATEKKNG
ncbi:MAG: hypothetical protein IJG83_07005 [Thermoguttaceae bacterium]|nr:hypothetical protein [Thermoguttaceae bacterium]